MSDRESLRFVTVALALCALAQPGTAAAQVTVERGRQVHSWFLSGQIDRIWALRSPSARDIGPLATPERLASRQRRFAHQYGSMTSFVSDRVRPSYENNTAYVNVAVYANYEGDVHVTWIFDQNGMVVGLNYPHYVTSTSRSSRARGDDLSDVLLIVLVGGGSFLFVALLVGVTIAVTLSIRRRQGRRWAAAARALGLEVEPFRPQMHSPIGKLLNLKPPKVPTFAQRMMGRRGDMEVQIGVRAERRSSGDGSHVVYFTYVKALLDPPLQAGIRLRAADTAENVFAAIGLTEDLQVGDPAIDRAYIIRAVDREYAWTLLREPNLRDGLLRDASGPWRVILDDGSVRFERQKLEFDPGTLGPLLDRVTDLASRLRAARTRLPPPGLERTLRAAWAPFATANNLELDLHRSVMRGRYGGAEIEIEAVIINGRFWTEFRIKFDRPLGLSLSLTREGSLAGVGKLLGAQDIQIGDPAFDAAFLVKGRPEAAVRALLTPEVRGRLLEVQRDAKHLVVKDDLLLAQVDWLVSEASHLESGLRMVTQAAAALAGTAQGAGGPYRA